MKDKVWLRSPEGEEREVEATPGVLVPLMVAGWKQFFPEETNAESQ